VLPWLTAAALAAIAASRACRARRGSPRERPRG
jgi:hypothetical protein